MNNNATTCNKSSIIQLEDIINSVQKKLDQLTRPPGRGEGEPKYTKGTSGICGIDGYSSDAVDGEGCDFETVV